MRTRTRSRHSRIACILPAALLAVLAGCRDSAPPLADAPAPTVTASQPVVRKIVTHDDFEGRIAAAEKVEVRARVRGHLMKVNFTAGKIVKKDDLLYVIDQRPYKVSLEAANAQLKAAEGTLKLAKAEYEREASLVGQRATSAREVEVWAAKHVVAQGEVLKSKATVDQAQLDLDFTDVKAPMDGKIAKTLVDVGNLVNAGGGETLLTTIVSTSPWYVYFNVDERSLVKYRRVYGKAAEKIETVKDLKIPVYVALEGEEDYPHKGMIDYVDNKVNPNTGTVQVRGILESEKPLYEDGMRARVRVPIGDPYEAILVTERTFGTDQGRKFVYVVNDKGIAQRRDVTLGRQEAGLQVVEKGLKADDWVIVNGIQRVREGTEVKPNKVAMPGAN